MMPHEQQLLEQFLQRVNAAQGIAQDPQAQAMIQQRLAQQPDATYLLVQRALLLEQALEAAQQHIQQLEQQAASHAASGGSFLGQGLDTRFGRNPEPAGIPAYSAPATNAPGLAAAPGSWRQRWFGAAPTAAPAAPVAPAAASPAGGSWLGSAASTAAGVAGGMFLFNELENLLGGPHNTAGANPNALTGQSDPSPALGDAGHSSLAQDAGASHVQDPDNWASGSSDDSSFLDDDSSWDA